MCREDILVLKELYELARTRNSVNIELVPKIISQENVFNALYDIHVMKLGHAGPEKMHKLVMSEYSNVSRKLCEIFYRCCPICLLNKRCPGKAKLTPTIAVSTANKNAEDDKKDVDYIFYIFK